MGLQKIYSGAGNTAPLKITGQILKCFTKFPFITGMGSVCLCHQDFIKWGLPAQITDHVYEAVKASSDSILCFHCGTFTFIPYR